jgi:hypothetical protein
LLRERRRVHRDADGVPRRHVRAVRRRGSNVLRERLLLERPLQQRHVHVTLRERPRA